MNEDYAIRARGLGKRYKLGETIDLNRTFRETVAMLPRLLLRRARETNDARDFWALRDIDLEVRRGEAVGIIGRNGAGKSTLLKILSRITHPTTGEAEIRGRVGSLLEVGTGFHPELTGRENIYLNGAILGMTRVEIRRRFDAIVAFAGTEKFLDTPVKRYSSGMRVRLGFAVAAHLDPEILIIDEVLAVGDAEFRSKCLGKMQDVAEGGRTVLFVSHNMGAVRRLCSRAVLLDSGRIAKAGPTEEVLDHYLRSIATTHASRADFPPNPAQTAQIRSIEVRQANGEPIDRIVPCSQPIDIFIGLELRGDGAGIHSACYLSDASGDFVLFSDLNDHPDSPAGLRRGSQTLRIRIPGPLLMPGRYTVTVGLTASKTFLDIQRNAVSFELVDDLSERESRPGHIYLPLAWEVADAD